MRYLIILLLLTGCSTTQLPPKPRPQSYDMVTFCKTYGGVKHCVYQETKQKLLQLESITNVK